MCRSLKNTSHSYTDLLRCSTPAGCLLRVSALPGVCKKGLAVGASQAGRSPYLDVGQGDENLCTDSAVMIAQDASGAPFLSLVHFLHRCRAAHWWAWSPFHSESDPGQPFKLTPGSAHARWHQLITHGHLTPLPPPCHSHWWPGLHLPVTRCPAPSCRYLLGPLTTWADQSVGKIPHDTNGLLRYVFPEGVQLCTHGLASSQPQVQVPFPCDSVSGVAAGLTWGPAPISKVVKDAVGLAGLTLNLLP